jgi:nitrate reductase gamma subunit
MSGPELLLWARGTGLQIAVAIFVFGLLVRFVELWLLGRKTDLSVARANPMKPGLRTVVSRSLPMPGALKHAPLVFLGGYIFHIGFLLTLLFYVPHIHFLRSIFGFGWPGLPPFLIDVIGLVTIATLIALLVQRFTDPVRRFLSRADDYVAWTVTFLPLLSGYAAFHRLGTDFTTMLALHILSVELLLIVIPFTKLMHMFTFVLARWYNGAIAGRKGVAS